MDLHHQVFPSSLSPTAQGHPIVHPSLLFHSHRTKTIARNGLEFVHLAFDGMYDRDGH